ncbi:DUF1064 domain-containing protein [Sediminimonas sp.]|uniref:DUF1064 domain-containing protein n=1 Tax=Sediminimonas sp. TaxID=2823379 RepID=UPI0025F20432|nr:DUF1064 domain-containing protein [Sediminimonas sp.]
MTQNRIPAAVYRAELAGKTGKKAKTTPAANKYGATKVTRGGITFDSKREADRYDQLLMLERGGVITHLQRQVWIDLIGADGAPLKSDSGRVLHYLADFTYRDDDGRRVVEDSKGISTRVFKLKKAMLRAQGVEVVEV